MSDQDQEIQALRASHQEVLDSLKTLVRAVCGTNVIVPEGDETIINLVKTNTQAEIIVRKYDPTFELNLDPDRDKTT